MRDTNDGSDLRPFEPDSIRGLALHQFDDIAFGVIAIQRTERPGASVRAVAIRILQIFKDVVTIASNVWL